MVGTILPVVNGARQVGSTLKLLSMYSLASIVGSSISGVLLAACGLSLTKNLAGADLLPLIFAAIALGLSVIELKFMKAALPQFKRQVPHAWRFLRPSVMVSLYGGVLGLGFGTRITVATFYAVAFHAVISRDFLLAGAIFSLYGFGRSFPCWWLRKPMKTLGFECLDASLSRYPQVVSVVNGLALAFVGSFVFGAHFSAGPR